jgi:pimeloyl-ACP methyl ester carboxylesterase
LLLWCVACASARPHVELDVPADDGLACHVYVAGDRDPRVVILWMGGTGLGSSAFVPADLDVPHAAIITFDKPGVRAPFGDPAKVTIDDAVFRRYTQGTLVACARRALARFGATPVILRGHSEGTLIALALADDPRVRALVLSGLPLEPFDVLVRRQLATRPAFAAAIGRCDWPAMKQLGGVSCEYLADASKRPSGRKLFEQLGTRVEIDVLAGTDDDLTPVSFVRDLVAWNTASGHLDLHVYEYRGGHLGTDEAHRTLAALIRRLAQ